MLEPQTTASVRATSVDHRSEPKWKHGIGSQEKQKSQLRTHCETGGRMHVLLQSSVSIKLHVCANDSGFSFKACAGVIGLGPEWLWN